MNQFQTIEDWPCGQVTKYVKTRSSQVEIRRRSFRRGNSHGKSRHKSCNLGHWPLGPPTGRTLIYCCWRLVSIGGRGQDRTLLIEVGVAQGPGGRVRLLSRVPSCVCYQEVDAVKPGESLCARIWRPICLRTLPPPPQIGNEKGKKLRSCSSEFSHLRPVSFHQSALFRPHRDLTNRNQFESPQSTLTPPFYLFPLDLPEKSV